MVRKKLVIPGKYFLYNKRERLFLHAKGVYDDGSGPEKYTHWTPYFGGAQGFVSLRAAKAMQKKLLEQRDRVIIVDRDRKVVWNG